MKTTSWNSVCVGNFKRAGMLGGAALAWWGLLCPAWSGGFHLVVKDQKGRPVENAVVWAKGTGPNPSPVEVEIFQKGRQFQPEVTVIPVGSTVRFPNRDNVQHHVYSFSPAKPFDIPLYIGEAPNPVKFDRPGVVTLGCNIHDWMTAYILILDTPWHARSGADGGATLHNLPAGTDLLLIWHPRLRVPPVEWRLDQGAARSGEIVLPLRPAFPRTPPQGEGGGYH